MAARGPDGSGEWISPGGEIGLGHRRLAIIDLSPAGAQPMSWAEGRYWITYNGEIYNYRELREELEDGGVLFRSHGDTEVILALYERDGLGMLPRLRGMFAFALWDEREHILLLARDPLGIKPLYYSTEGGYFRFASQVKALEAGGAISCEPDPAGVVGFLLWGSVPEPFTIRKSVHALPAGTWLRVKQGQVGTPQAQGTLGQVKPRAPASVADALADSVRAHLVSDVPVGIFLSGGHDSAMLTTLACRFLPQPPIAFTLCFDRFAGTSLDEAPVASEIAKALGVRHIVQRVDRRDFPNLWSDVLQAMDQPSIDGFNTYVVSHAASHAGLKVVLSGLGGDELFGGYPSFSEVPRWAAWTNLARHVPGLSAVFPLAARRIRPRQPKLAGLLRYDKGLAGAYFLRRGLFLPEELPEIVDRELVRAGLRTYDPFEDAGSSNGNNPASNLPSNDPWALVHAMETAHYMRNQLLRDTDWASMAHSLEVRVPYVDTWLGNRVASLNFEPARSRGRRATYREIAPELPSAVWNRAKSGFLIPVADWLDERSKSNEPTSWGLSSRRIAVQVLREFLPVSG